MPSPTSTRVHVCVCVCVCVCCVRAFLLCWVGIRPRFPQVLLGQTRSTPTRQEFQLGCFDSHYPLPGVHLLRHVDYFWNINLTSLSTQSVPQCCSTPLFHPRALSARRLYQFTSFCRALLPLCRSKQLVVIYVVHQVYLQLAGRLRPASIHR